MRRIPSRPALTLTAVLAAACVQDDAPAADFIINYDGVIPVTNIGPPPPARLDLVVSIGPKTLTDTGSPEEFGSVTSVALGPGGEIFVADGRNREVRVFGLDGAHRRTFGREGEGPGEFQSLYSLAWACDQTGRLVRPPGTHAAGRETVHRGSLRRSGRQALGRGRAHGREPLGGF